MVGGLVEDEQLGRLRRGRGRAPPAWPGRPTATACRLARRPMPRRSRTAPPSQPGPTAARRSRGQHRVLVEVARRGCPGPAGRAPDRELDPGEHPEQGRLPRAVDADEADAVPVGDSDGEVLEERPVGHGTPTPSRSTSTLTGSTVLPVWRMPLPATVLPGGMRIGREWSPTHRRLTGRAGT